MSGVKKTNENPEEVNLTSEGSEILNLQTYSSLLNVGDFFDDY